jgi:hypothetical protein
MTARSFGDRKPGPSAGERLVVTDEPGRLDARLQVVAEIERTTQLAAASRHRQRGGERDARFAQEAAASPARDRERGHECDLVALVTDEQDLGDEPQISQSACGERAHERHVLVAALVADDVGCDPDLESLPERE